MPKIPRLRIPATKRIIYQGPENYLVKFWDQSGERFEDADFYESSYDRASLAATYMINNSTTKRPRIEE